MLEALTNDLNRLLRDEHLYEEDRFRSADADLRQKAKMIALVTMAEQRLAKALDVPEIRTIVARTGSVAVSDDIAQKPAADTQPAMTRSYQKTKLYFHKQ